MASRTLPLTPGGRIVAVTGVLFLLDTFLPWHRLCVGVLDAKVCRVDQAWDTSLSTLAALLVLAVVAELIAVQGAGLRWSGLGRWSAEQVALGLSAGATALVLLQLIVGDGNLDRAYGSYFGLVLAAGLTYGSYLRNAESPVLSPGRR